MEAQTRVLVVDDEPGIGRVLSIKLNLHGFDVTTTTSGTEAIELIRNNEPDVVLLDILMPGVTGIEVLDRVRAFSSVPIIIFTAKSDMAQRAIELGADGYMAKPFDPDKMLAKIRSVIGRDGHGKAV
jgi:DNA-binding response OmpR family regulator